MIVPQRTTELHGDEFGRVGHLMWVQTRLMIDQQYTDSVRNEFSLIAAGFGSFSIFEDLTLGERAVSELP